MATKYRCSGQVRITVKYNDRNDNYQVTLRSPAGKGTLRGIRLSPYDRGRLAVDSAKATTKVAQAALSFCTEDHGSGNDAAGREMSRCGRAVRPDYYMDTTPNGEPLARNCRGRR